MNRSAARIWHGAVIILLVPVALWLTVRPDWYAYQNGLDPYFYTGYAQNFDDSLALTGDRHYFVSRWSIYLPNRLFYRLFGAESGFIALHALLCVLIAAVLWAFKCQRGWRLSTAALCVVVVLTSPALVRAVFGDYSDSIAVPFGIVLISLLCAAPSSRIAAFSAGCAAGLVVVANPFGATLIGCALVAGWLPQRIGMRAGALVLTAFGAGAALVILGGLLLFRWRYGIPNVYAPTIDFLGSDRALKTVQHVDGLYWLRYRLWLYAPLTVLGTWAYMVRVRRVSFDPTERAILRVLLLQFTIHVLWQFMFNGVTLELPFYWSYVVPALMLSTVVVVARLAESIGSRTTLAIAAGVVLLLAIMPSPAPELLPNWQLALGFVVAFAAVSWFSYRPAVMVSVLISVLLAVHLGAPRPEPRPVDAVYDPAFADVFHPDGRSRGEDGFRALSWFVEEMDAFGDPVEHSLYFWIGGGHAHRLAAAYQAHVSGRWIDPGWSETATVVLSDEAIRQFASGLYPHVAILGTADQVDGVLARLRRTRPDLVVMFDQDTPSDLATRVVIIEVPAQRTT